MAYKPANEKTSCSSCGRDFGPGDAGYSHCEDHEDWAELCSLYRWFTMNGERPMGSYPMVERMMDLGVPYEVACLVDERISNLSVKAKDLGRWAVLSA